MTVPTGSLITKGLFAVSVVAITAIVGAVGFAQAQHQGVPHGTGYGGIGEQIRAAAQEFQEAVQDAHAAFQEDVQACLAEFNGGAAANQTGFFSRNNNAINGLRAVASNPNTLSQNPNQLAGTMTAAQGVASAQLDANAEVLMAQVNATQHQQRAGQLRACLNEARNTFRAAVNDARDEFLATIRSILGR
jgi:hypothetical protein